jgi:hypothetical protein
MFGGASLDPFYNLKHLGKLNAHPLARAFGFVPEERDPALTGPFDFRPMRSDRSFLGIPIFRDIDKKRSTKVSRGMIPVASVHQQSRNVTARMQRCLSKGLVVVVNVTDPMRVNEIDLFALDDMQNLDIQGVDELDLQCLERAADKFVDAKYPNCLFTFTASDSISSNESLIRRAIFRIGRDVNKYAISLCLVLGESAPASKLNVVKMRADRQNIHVMHSSTCQLSLAVRN